MSSEIARFQIDSLDVTHEGGFVVVQFYQSGKAIARGYVHPREAEKMAIRLAAATAMAHTFDELAASSGKDPH